MLRGGLRARVVGVELLPEWDNDGLLAIVLEIDELVLSRSHADRGFKLHISLAYLSELGSDAWAAAYRIHRRYAGRDVVLRVDWIGRGGSASLGAGDLMPTTWT